jgi:hypothetical protein
MSFFVGDIAAPCAFASTTPSRPAMAATLATAAPASKERRSSFGVFLAIGVKSSAGVYEKSSCSPDDIPASFRRQSKIMRWPPDGET